MGALYIMLFMAVVAFVAVGGYSIIQWLNDYYEREEF